MKTKYQFSTLNILAWMLLLSGLVLFFYLFYNNERLPKEISSWVIWTIAALPFVCGLLVQLIVYVNSIESKGNTRGYYRYLVLSVMTLYIICGGITYAQGVVPLRNFSSLIGEADRLLIEDDPEKALRIYQDILDSSFFWILSNRKTKSSLLHLRCGLGNVQLGNLVEANESFAKAVMLQPELSYPEYLPQSGISPFLRQKKQSLTTILNSKETPELLRNVNKYETAFTEFLKDATPEESMNVREYYSLKRILDRCRFELYVEEQLDINKESITVQFEKPLAPVDIYDQKYAKPKERRWIRIDQWDFRKNKPKNEVPIPRIDRRFVVIPMAIQNFNVPAMPGYLIQGEAEGKYASIHFLYGEIETKPQNQTSKERVNSMTYSFERVKKVPSHVLIVDNPTDDKLVMSITNVQGATFVLEPLSYITLKLDSFIYQESYQKISTISIDDFLDIVILMDKDSASNDSHVLVEARRLDIRNYKEGLLLYCVSETTNYRIKSLGYEIN